MNNTEGASKNDAETKSEQGRAQPRSLRSEKLRMTKLRLLDSRIVEASDERIVVKIPFARKREDNFKEEIIELLERIKLA